MTTHEGGNNSLTELVSDIRLAAEIAGAPFQDEIVWAILKAYEPWFTNYAVAFRITTKVIPELNVRYQTLTPHDPYAIALEHGLLTRTDHPIHDAIWELRALRPNAGYLIDIGVTHGFEKIWGYFAEPFTIEEICALDTMPQSLKDHLPLFKRYGLNWVSAVGVDYVANTTNPYFMRGSFPNDAEIAAQFVQDCGFERPSPEENEHNGQGFVIYPTFAWNSDAVERLSYACGGPQEQVPTHWHPLMKKFAEQVPLRGPVRGFTWNTCYGRGIPNYYKLEGDYRGNVFQYIAPLIDGVLEKMQ